VATIRLTINSTIIRYPFYLETAKILDTPKNVRQYEGQAGASCVGLGGVCTTHVCWEQYCDTGSVRGAARRQAMLVVATVTVSLYSPKPKSSFCRSRFSAHAR
jgi:hypothetical protein